MKTVLKIAVAILVLVLIYKLVVADDAAAEHA